MKRLMILRHAKSDWEAVSKGDHDRPLNRRGTRSAKRMGAVVARAGETPDLIISSSARRARTTAQLAMETGQWDSSIEITDALYGTSVQGAFHVAAGSDPDLDRLMLVGHQPTWGSLVAAVTGATVQVRTATLVAIDLHITGWSRIANARGEIAYVLQPRLFDGDDWPDLS